MAGAPLGNLVSTVDRAVGVVPSATALINGFADRQAAAIAASLALGASEAELAPLTELNQDLSDKVDALASAVNSHPA